MVAWVDGAWIDEREACVPVNDRGFMLGDGVYDTCRLFEGRWFRFDEHARRLHRSAAILRIDPPPPARLRQIADELLERAGVLDHAVLRMTVTRGSGGRGVGTEGAGPPRTVLTIRGLPPDWLERARRGWRCITADVRHPPPSVMPPALKGQGRIFSLLATLEAEAAGCDQALLLSTGGHITEGATWNVFWRRGDVVRTPAEETGILAGATRGVLLDLVPEAGYRLETGAWDRAELEDADEVFATMTSSGLVPVLRLDGRELPEPRAATDRLAKLYWDRVREETHG